MIQHHYTGGMSTDYPYFALGDLSNRIVQDSAYGFSQTPLKDAANDVLDALGQAVVYVYASPDKGNYYGPGSTVKRGLGIFWATSSGAYGTNGEWYTALDANAAYGTDYGLIDFADANGNGTVESWKELMEYWYDSGNTNTTAETW